jgi:hypothetical protein
MFANGMPPNDRSSPRTELLKRLVVLAWAMAHADCAEEDFRSVLWSENARRKKARIPRTDWVFRTLYEKWDIDYV